jgi:nitrogen fixation/metabolism regulation signal transduction histidine kinase
MAGIKNKYSNILKAYRLNLIFRIIILTLTIFFVSIAFVREMPVIVILLSALVVIYEAYELFKYLDTTNRRLSSFLLSIKYSDFTRTLPASGMGSSFKELEDALNEVFNEFKLVRNEKEEHTRFLQTVIQHIGLGLISYQQSGKVELINNAAKKLLKINSLVSINSLETINKPVYDKLLSIEAGKKELVKFVDNNELSQLLLYATEFKRQDKMYKLVSIQNIQRELDEKEMESWQRLISVLTHEIMNSITPISSLAQTIETLLKENTIDDNNLADIKTGIETIRRRSQGLIGFVNNYRALTKIPVPDFSIIKIEDLFSQVNKLLENKFSEDKIIFNYTIEPISLELTVDPKLIEQVLINLLLNSIDALKETTVPEIAMNAVMGEKGQVLIQIKDNGAGILENVLEKIFIPFFTTKKNGSGIGLSLARQVMRQHGGNITVISRLNEYTIFTLIFNC